MSKIEITWTTKVVEYHRATIDTADYEEDVPTILGDIDSEQFLVDLEGEETKSSEEVTDRCDIEYSEVDE